MNRGAIAVHMLLKSLSTKSRINNRSLNKVIDGLIEDKELFNKSIPKDIKTRIGRDFKKREE